MSVVDKVIAAFAPPEDDEQRAEARAKARAAATPGDWLSLVLKHHGELEALFAGVKSATTAEAQRQAEKRLGVMLVGHAIAEESVLYPALARAGENHQAGLGYTEQAAVKMQMAELERLTPLTPEYMDKIGHIEGAVQHHMYEEEGTWFLDLKRTASAADQERATKRYKEEFDRYVGRDPLFFA